MCLRTYRTGEKPIKPVLLRGYCVKKIKRFNGDILYSPVFSNTLDTYRIGEWYDGKLIPILRSSPKSDIITYFSGFHVIHRLKDAIKYAENVGYNQTEYEVLSCAVKGYITSGYERCRLYQSHEEHSIPVSVFKSIKLLKPLARVTFYAGLRSHNIIFNEVKL